MLIYVQKNPSQRCRVFEFPADHSQVAGSLPLICKIIELEKFACLSEVDTHITQYFNMPATNEPVLLKWYDEYYLGFNMGDGQLWYSYSNSTSTLRMNVWEAEDLPYEVGRSICEHYRPLIGWNSSWDALAEKLSSQIVLDSLG